ncbi:AP-3 complex subunit beta-2 [Liparis tanakae]|uniref:AP-3 complex subunit beta-2 n=1 Tax=Liparis tanakae TaxID=230148 RepID=A0A4Z2IRP3_9TELE|nr:AP-3 complex subunit beta-2 [Liparis tanakae]
MSASSAFNDEKGGSSSVGEPEYGHDPASGGIFSSDYKRLCREFRSTDMTAMQRLLLQLPVNAANIVKTVQSQVQGHEEDKSPVLHDDLKEMLDSNKDSLKLEAMKRIVAMIARGKNASDLFPAVVKNVACKNIEVKKLVYVYLVRYAEEQQDLALLSISTFQRGLKVRQLSQ